MSENNNAGNMYDAPNQEVVRAGDDKPPKPPKPDQGPKPETVSSDTPVSEEAPTSG